MCPDIAVFPTEKDQGTEGTKEVQTFNLDHGKGLKPTVKDTACSFGSNGIPCC